MANAYRHYNSGEASKYDDFNPTKNYVKVLYNPSRAVQARELTQSQTYLNHQIGAMGGYLFQDGQPIDGAKISFSETQPIVQIDIENKPLDIISFFEGIIGKRLKTTSSSGQEIIVTGYRIIQNKYYLLFAYCGSSIYNVNTDNLYKIYLDHADNNNNNNNNNKPRIVIKEPPTHALVGVCTEGTIFIDGYFIYVPRSEVVVALLPQKTDTEKYETYKNTEFHIGFDITRKEVNATEDITLNDNAVGSYNYKAPGANRYQIRATLNGYKSTEVPQNVVGDGIDFIPGIILKNSTLIKEQPLEYDSSLRDMLARRTYEESGSYAVTPWKVSTDKLTENDVIPNDESDTRTDAEKRDDYYGVNISPGLGYIYGYRVSNLITERKLNKKPRSTIQKFNILNYTPDGMYVKAKKVDGVVKAKNFPPFMSELKILNIALTPTSDDEPITITKENIIGTCVLVEALYEGNNELRLYLTNLTLSKFDISNARCLAVDENTYIDLPFSYEVDENGNIVVDDETGQNKIAEVPILYGNETSKIVRTGYSMISPTFESSDILANSLNYEYFSEFTTVANDGYIGVPKNSGDEVKRIVYIYDNEGNHINVSKGIFERNYTRWVSEDIKNGKTYTVCMIYERDKNGSSQIRNKYLKESNVESYSYNGESFIEVQNEDVFDIVSLKITSVNDIQVSDNDDYKEFIILKNEQTDFLYKQGRLINFQDLVNKLEEVYEKSIGAFTFNIKYRYFEHSDGVGPFTASSYVKLEGKNANQCIAYKDIPVYRSLNGEVYELRDCLDFRVKESSKSNVLVPYRSPIKYNVSMYLPRIDRVWVDKSGNFGITQGIPSLSPELPNEKDGTMTLYYLYNDAYGEKVSVKYVNNKRHTMSDITKLENRITNVENVLSLSLLEQSAVNMQITDTAGLNRYKSGIFTDNFTLYDTHDCVDEHWKCSIDAIESSLRPAFECENIEFSFDAKNVNNINVTAWGDDVPRTTLGAYATNDVPKLPNTILTATPTGKVLWVSNGGCSEATNIQSLMFYVWIGELKITPTIDTWVNDLGNILVKETWTETPKPKTTYRSWSVTSVYDTKTTTSSSNSSTRRVVDRWGSYWTDTYRTTTTTTNTTYETKNTTETTSYVGSWEANEQYEKMESQDNYMRVRDVKFRLKGMRPGIKIYATMDDKPLTLWNMKHFDEPKPTKNITESDYADRINSDTTLEGCFTVPEKMLCGTKLIQFFDDEDKCAASAEYTANGKTVWTEVTRNYIRTWTAVVSTDTQTSYRTTSNTTSTKTKLSSVYTNLDPIAESFYIDNPNGIMLESIDLFFAKKDENVNVELIVVECENGYPSQTMVPFSRVVKTPSEVNVREIGEVSATTPPIATNFKFESPLYLYPETEYAFIVIAQSYGYELYTSTLGKADLITGIGIKEQPYIGSMFKSQNLRTWTAEQMSDIMFNIYKYSFTKGDVARAFFDIVPLKDAEGNSKDFKSAMQTLSLNTFVPSQTEIKYFYNWDNTEWKQFNNKEDIFNDIEYSTYTENNHLRLRCDMYTDDKNISPMIDLEQVYGIFTNNQCEEVKNAYDTFVKYDCGSYVSVPIKLANNGEDLRVILDAVLPKDSEIAVYYKTTPIIHYYFNTGRIGCGSKLSEDDVNILKNKEVSFYQFRYDSEIKKSIMTPVDGESRCVIMDYVTVPSELVASETIGGVATKYTSTGRLYIKNLSNDDIISSPQLEKVETENHGYYVMQDYIEDGFEVVNWKKPIYNPLSVVIHNNLLWVNTSEVKLESEPNKDTMHWKNITNATPTNIPKHSTSNVYSAWSLVKDDDNYYYISITDVPQGQQLNASGTYWRKVDTPTIWCYPYGTYVFRNDSLWKCIAEEDGEEANAGFNEPSDVSILWKKIHCVKLISPVKTKEDADWCEMRAETNNTMLSSIDTENSFNEYTFIPKYEMTGDFTSFALRIDMFSQDKVNVPRVKNLRAIALI